MFLEMHFTKPCFVYHSLQSQLRERYKTSFYEKGINGILKSIFVLFDSWIAVKNSYSLSIKPKKLYIDENGEYKDLVRVLNLMKKCKIMMDDKVSFSMVIEDEFPQRGFLYIVEKDSNTDIWYKSKHAKLDYVSDRLITHYSYATSKNPESLMPRMRGSWNYVILKTGQVIASRSLGHYYLSLQQTHQVRYAGTAVFSAGILQSWDNGSGHFKPHPSFSLAHGVRDTIPFPHDKFESIE